MAHAASVGDYRALARRRLPHFLFEYLDGGAHDEITARRNLADLEAVVLRQRVLRDVGDVDLATTLFGQRMSMPVVLGPVGLAGMMARRGEGQAARAAAAAGVPFCLSTVGACSIGEVRKASDAPFWFQLYVMRDRGFTADLVAQAAGAGCPALVLTVDMPVPGTRYRDRRSGLAGAPGLGGKLRRLRQAMMRPGWAWDVGIRGRPHALGNVAPLLGARTGLEDYFAWMAANFDPSVTWDDVDWIRSRWPGALIVKGILEPDDARLAVAHGADAIVVSNHGGRQLDGAPSTARALPAIARSIGNRVPVLADGGVRSGIDVVRLMALGARAVLLGRAWAYALGGAGRTGVRHALQLIDAEMRVAMALTGTSRVGELDERNLHH